MNVGVIYNISILSEIKQVEIWNCRWLLIWVGIIYCYKTYIVYIIVILLYYSI